MKQEDLIIDARRDIQYSVKLPNVMTYYNIEFASAELQFENTWKEFFDDKWLKSMSFLKQTNIQYAQAKAHGDRYYDYYTDYSNNTKVSNRGLPHTELLTYWNMVHTDDRITTTWKFYTFIDNLSFLGGLLDITLLIPSFIMVAYTFRINEINVFYYQQKMKKYFPSLDKDKDKRDYVKYF